VPGEETDSIAVAIPPWSISCRWLSTSQVAQPLMPSGLLVPGGLGDADVVVGDEVCVHVDEQGLVALRVHGRLLPCFGSRASAAWGSRIWRATLA